MFMVQTAALLTLVCGLVVAGDVLAQGEARRAGPQTLLLVDDHHVLYRPGTKRVLRPLTRHAQNPVIPADKQWEKANAYCSVHRDPQSGKYQLWYQSLAHGTPEATHVCYAESDDGIQWVKPELGIHSYGRLTQTNIVVAAEPGQYGASVVFDPRDPDPARRYKMALWRNPDGYNRRTSGLGVAFSPDGIHWTRHGQSPLLPGSFGKSSDTPFVDDAEYRWGDPLALSDVIDAAYDPPRGKFMIYGKTWLDGPDGKTIWQRAIVRTESDDFIHWSRPQLVMAPDEGDGTGVEYQSPIQRSIKGKVGSGRRGTQLHGGPVFFHSGVYFSLLQVMDGEITGGMPIELAISRNGLDWQRPFRKELFLPVTCDHSTFDAGCIWSSASPVLLDDEFRFYYGAYSSTWKGAMGKSATGIGLATLPRDRFAGLRPLHEIGQITLKSLPLAGCPAMTLNADASRGTIRVELLNEHGFRLRGYTKDDAAPITGDSLRHPVSWREARLDQLPPGRYRLRLHLENAEVFAITVQ